MTDLVFTSDDLQVKEVPVKIADVDYILREADGAAASRYQSAAVRGSKFAKGGKEITLGDIGEVELILLAGCLFYAENNRAVPLGIIRAWPNRVTKELAKRAKELSGLNDAEDDADAIRAEIERLTNRLREIEEDSLGNLSSGNTAGSA